MSVPFGIGEREDRYPDFTQSPGYDDDRYRFGGYAGGARDAKANL